MEWFVAVAAVLLVAALGLALALAMESARSEVLGADAQRLASLARFRSPSGKSFYPTGEAPLELSAELEEVTAGSGETAPTRPRAR